MRFQFILLFITYSILLIGQKDPDEIVYSFFNAMYLSDTIAIDELLHEDAILVSTFVKNEQNGIGGTTKKDFLRSVSQAQPGDLDEQISNLIVQRDNGLATIWMDYTFYYQGKLSHCGVNAFTLVLESHQWKIVSISDTRRKSNCGYDDVKSNIGDMLDQWHLSASVADSISYFDLMTVNSIYVGTDKTEVWSKQDFLSFAAPYFAKGKAWSFTKLERNIYSNDFKDVAWFDEILDTWMGPCRGSGVVVKNKDGQWRIQHYVLSVAIDNDDIQGYLKLIKEDKK